ncbi:DUF7521 family protein [Natrialba asiatica]|uniref:Uncharacterized protein n=1 Tax=Natrialba asiatica (strain ATCC 700177 / DSM 12278 / JCM 9576 / FERM P-10747 / NBRC 102637 / 172P1) TaxID=29540 RepID=M0AUU9_NATA1|nr:hypothetical protein [Natrialba asiatica]ELZ02340.1 hypothetical protein C481_06706 [Natrialba asiatica DSM 12278]
MLPGVRPIELAVGALAAGATLLGLYIGYQAFRAWGRHRDPSMRYLALGLLLLTVGTYSMSFVGTVLINLRLLSLPQQDWFWLAVHTAQFTGLALIAYALHRRP